MALFTHTLPAVGLVVRAPPLEKKATGLLGGFNKKSFIFKV